MSGIKLVYFDIRGRGETSRLVLAAAGQEWEDVRIPFAEWPATKETTPYGQLPYLEYDGTAYGQSQAIAGFLARQFGLNGRSNMDGLRIMEVSNLVEDFLQLMGKANFEKDEDKKAELMLKLMEEGIPRFLGYFERLLAENSSRAHFVGNTLSVADLAVFDVTDTVLQLAPEALEAFPEVRKLRAKVAAHPNLSDYLASRKLTRI